MKFITFLQSIQLITSTAANIHWVTTYIDSNETTGAIPATSDGLSNTNTATTIISTPVNGYQRQVADISILNTDSVNTNVYIQITDGAVKRIMFGPVNLLPGYSLQYSSSIGWQVFNSQGFPGGFGGGGSGSYEVDVYAQGVLSSANVGVDFLSTALSNVAVAANGSISDILISANQAAVLAGVIPGNVSNIAVTYYANGNIGIDTRLTPGSGNGGGGAYQVDVYANGTLVLANGNMNFNNTISINVAAAPNGSPQANVAFNINTSMNLVSLNVSGNIANAGNIKATQNIAAGNLAITQNASFGNITTANINASATINTTANIAAGNVAVTQNISGGNLSLTQNISAGNVAVTALLNAATLNASTLVQTGNGTTAAPAHTFGAQTNTGLYLTTTNVLGIAAGGNGVVNVGQTSVNIFGAVLNVTSNISNVGNALVTQNVYAGNVIVTQNISGGNLSITQNAVFGNVNAVNVSLSSNLSVPNLVVTGSETTGNLTVTQNCNVISLSAVSNITANNLVVTGFVNIGNVSLTGTLTADNVVAVHNLTAGAIWGPNASTTVRGVTELIDSISSIDTGNAATANSVAWVNSIAQTAISLGAAAYNYAGQAANLVAVYANGTLVLANANLNFNNSASLNVNLTPNGSGQVNIAFTVNASAVNGNGGGGGSGSYQVDVYANGTAVLANADLNFNNSSSVNVVVTANGTVQANSAFAVNMLQTAINTRPMISSSLITQYAVL